MVRKYKHKRLINILMAVLLIIAVYVSAYVLLPDGINTNGRSIYNEDDSIQIDFTKKTVVIDSGHGGIDPGKESSNGILEKNINIAIAYKLKSLLEGAQINVVMTRTDDNGLYTESDSNKKVADMKKRCDIIDKCKPDVVVSIHQNSFQSTSVSGAQVFYYKHSQQGRKFAHILQDSLKETLDPENERVEKADNTYYMLLHTSAPTVIAECGFLSNPREAQLLNSEEYQQKVAQALYNGIIKYFTGSDTADTPDTDVSETDTHIHDN